jgi:predicted metal-dependent hydrolase
MLRLPRKNAPRISGITYLDISYAGEIYRVNLRRIASARRFTLRVRAATQDVVLTMPARGSLGEAGAFANRHSAWIVAKLRRLPEKIGFTPGQSIPLRGTLHEIIHRSSGRRGVWIEETMPNLWEGARPVLCVGAERPHVPRRVRDFLIGEAKRELRAAVAQHAEKLGVVPAKITLRDTTSRWGSCSASGALNFSWRLIMAPTFVLDYLAAHEVAHLRHMNHSPAFWTAVSLMTADMERAEAWLKAQGSSLHRFGADKG